MNIVTSTKKTKSELKALIVQAVYEVLQDPDFGLELTEKVKKRLRAARASEERTIPLLEIKKKYS